MAIVPVIAAIALYDRRGWPVAVAALAVYGALAAAYILAWERLVRWGSDNPVTDAAGFGVFTFFGLAFIPSLPIAVCLALALVAAAATLGVGKAMRARGGGRRVGPS